MAGSCNPVTNYGLHKLRIKTLINIEIALFKKMLHLAQNPRTSALFSETLHFL
jgi:hypothetical protein